MGAEITMSIRIGYLLPTRERVMAGQPHAAPLLESAGRAERLGFDSVWAGDPLLARPRHEPAACSKACGSPVCYGAGNRSIGTVGGKSSTASLARHHIVKAGPQSGSADRC